MQEAPVLNIVDRSRLWRLWEDAQAAGRARGPAYKGLSKRLEASQAIQPVQIPPDVLTMNSRAIVRDLEDDEQYEVSLVYPDSLSAVQRQISILSPAGLALLGSKVGDTVEFESPSGTRRLQIIRIVFQPEAAGDFTL